MEQSTQQTIATFTGTLVRRDYTPGQRFVQLVFREGKENHLCVSSRAAAAELPIGKKYRVEGEFRQVGDRAFIHEPKIWVAQKRKQKWFLHKPVLIGSSVAAAFLVTGGVVFALHSKPEPTLQARNTSAQSAFEQNSNSSSGDTAAPQTATDTPTTTPTGTQTSPAPTTTPKTTPKPTPTTPPPTAPQTPAVTPTTPPAPDCDLSDIPFDTVEVVSDQTPGSTIREGVLGQRKTCYPNGRSNPGVDEIIQAPIDKQIAKAAPQDPNPNS